jgi:ribosomal protein S18 acetylase RimI-like enzyme
VTEVETHAPELGHRRQGAGMRAFPDCELYARGCATLLASWEEYARGAPEASLQRAPGVAIAVFPEGPEREVYNNALFDLDLDGARRSAAVDAMEAAYAAGGVTRFAAWVHERDLPLRHELERRGYSLDTTTRAMGLGLGDAELGLPSVELGSAAWPQYVRLLGLPSGYQAGADPAAFHVLVGRLDGADVATALGYDVGGDRGIYNVSTLPHARRRGLGSALTALLLHDARARGCESATLQATPMAERLYAALGFRDLGRILEYVPGRGAEPAGTDRDAGSAT